MTNEKQLEIYKLLKSEIEDAKMQTEIKSEGDTAWLRFIALFTDKAIPAAVDINLLTLGEDTEAASIYATLAINLTDDVKSELSKLIPSLNFYNIFGSFGIIDNQLFCKYGIALSEVDDTELRCSEILDAIVVLYAAIDNVIGMLADIVSEKKTTEQIFAEGRLNRI
jgi:hypothetical protein